MKTWIRHDHRLKEVALPVGPGKFLDENAILLEPGRDGLGAGLRIRLAVVRAVIEPGRVAIMTDEHFIGLDARCALEGVGQLLDVLSGVGSVKLHTLNGPRLAFGLGGCAAGKRAG